jgi:hypothetical protein
MISILLINYRYWSWTSNGWQQKRTVVTGTWLRATGRREITGEPLVHGNLVASQTIPTVTPLEPRVDREQIDVEPVSHRQQVT